MGARAGASDVKSHPFFRTTQWALIRHMKPPMIPNQGRGIDTVNFRNVKESESVDISGSRALMLPKGVPLDSGLATPAGEAVVDPFEECGRRGGSSRPKLQLELPYAGFRP